ncbi:hypothetical protein NEDG_00601 [Nematocida displodere]|uniref:Uncharacterized protein n=1 Tax=Nematocida displodere TaxID=1805483 RepID=A0A177ECB8_9MICR|nr:hypothetical protein NEDG_00601 [Nematocida displodere]
MEETHCQVKEKTEEVYAMGYTGLLNMIISGGGDDAITLHVRDGLDYQIGEVIEGLDDSVIFATFVRGMNPVAVTMDGTVVYLDIDSPETLKCVEHFEENIHPVSLNLDVSTAALSSCESWLYIGTTDGAITRVSASLPPPYTQDTHAVYMGHPSDVLVIEAVNEVIYTASHTQVILFCAETGATLKKYLSQEEGEIRTMKVHPTGKVVALGYSTGAVVLLSNSQTTNQGLLTVYRAEMSLPVESLAFVEDKLLYGGFDSVLKVVDLKYKTETECAFKEDASCIVKIIPLNASIAIAAITNGKVFIVDIRTNNKILKEFSIPCTITDIMLCGNLLCAATSEGVEVIDLTK